MRIALDAMGGDHAPTEIVRGAIQGALEHPDVTVILVGKQDPINRLLDEERRPSNITVLHASEEVGMDESPVDAIRKKRDSSLKRAVELVKNGEAEAAISAGNTGAMVAASTMILRTQPGIQKAGIAAILPTLNGFGVLIDVGANVNAKSLHLYHYALMGTVYARSVIGEEEQTVGLLSIGEEDAKGNELVKETNSIFNGSPLNFVGNVEGGDIFKGTARVVVCEGFVGNVVLKTAEGLSESLVTLFKRLMGDKSSSSTSGGAMREFATAFADRLDYASVGCAPLLGVNGISMIAHGRSSARAIKSSIGTTKKAIEGRINEKIQEGLAQFHGS